LCIARAAARRDVLLVEDDAVLGSRIEQALQTRGYRTRWITDGDEATAALGADAPIPAPLLLLGGDPRDPGTARLLKLIMRAEALERCRVILLGGDTLDPTSACHAPQPMIAEALAAGKVECVGAPLDVRALMQLVRGATRVPTRVQSDPEPPKG
jgi:DNA-binding NtrC family response regulator